MTTITCMNEYGSAEFMLVVGLLTLLLLFVAEMFDWTHLNRLGNNNLCTYSYRAVHGSSSWKDWFKSSKGKQQSPIDIASKDTIVVPAKTTQALTFSKSYHVVPKDFKIYNDGRSIFLCCTWINDQRPEIHGGPLNDTYVFYNARIHCGPADDEGSEHAIDSKKYAMELQAVHVKAGKNYCDLKRSVDGNAIAILSYFYEVTLTDNPYLEPLITILNGSYSVYNHVNLESFPLSWYMPPFSCKYYTYQGSLTFPPYTEDVEWIVNSEPLGISSRQLDVIKRKCGADGYVNINTRPLQELNGRNVFYYE